MCDNADLTLAQLSARTGYSIYTLSVAMGGETTPTWAVLSAIVEACGGDPSGWKSAWRDAAGHAVPFTAPLVEQPGTQELNRLSAAQDKQVRVLASGSGRGGRLTSPLTGSVQYATAVRPTGNDTDLVPALLRRFGPPPIPVTARTAAEFNDYVHRLRLWAGNPPVRDLALALGVSRGSAQNLLYPKDPKRLPKLELLMKLLAVLGVRNTMVMAEWAYVWRQLMYNDTIELRTQTRAEAQARRIANLATLDFQRSSSADSDGPEHGSSVTA